MIDAIPMTTSTAKFKLRGIFCNLVIQMTKMHSMQNDGLVQRRPMPKLIMEQTGLHLTCQKICILNKGNPDLALIEFHPHI